MPSSTDRKRLEIPTYLHDRLVEIAIDEDRTVASVAQQIIDAGLVTYQPGLIAQVDTSRFSPRALAALDAARAETVQFNHNVIGTEHLLLGLLKVEESIAARVLGNLGVNHVRCLRLMQAHFKRAESAASPLDTLRYAPRAKKALRLAVEEADKTGNYTVGTEHVLLGVAQVRDGIAAGILANFGVLDSVRDATHREAEKARTAFWSEQHDATPVEEPTDGRRDADVGSEAAGT